MAARERSRKKPAGAAQAVLSLKDIQDRFQSAVLTGDEAILSSLCDNSRTGRDTLFGVYRHAYGTRLVEVIANDHGFLKAYLGDDMFEEMARAYIAAHPSRSPNARWVSKDVAPFLSRTAPYCAHPEISELAAIEAALGRAFDAPDAPVIGIAELAALPLERWSSLSFTPHPSAERLRLTTNAFPIWQALSAGEEPPDAQRLAEPKPMLVWRHEAMPMIRELPPEEAMMWDVGSKGVIFEQLCEMVAVFGAPQDAAARAAQYLAGWLAAGLLSAFVERAPARRSKLA